MLVRELISCQETRCVSVSIKLRAINSNQQRLLIRKKLFSMCTRMCKLWCHATRKMCSLLSIRRHLFIHPQINLNFIHIKTN